MCCRKCITIWHCRCLCCVYALVVTGKLALQPRRYYISLFANMAASKNTIHDNRERQKDRYNSSTIRNKLRYVRAGKHRICIRVWFVAIRPQQRGCISSQTCDIAFIFSARQHTCTCCSALYAVARPSVCPFICPSHRWTSQRRLKLGSCNLHHRVSPWLVTLVFWRFSSRWNSKGKIGSGGAE